MGLFMSPMQPLVESVLSQGVTRFTGKFLLHTLAVLKAALHLRVVDVGEDLKLLNIFSQAGQALLLVCLAATENTGVGSL